MKAFYEDIASKKNGQSFVAYHLNVPAFEFKWHYHPEYELTLITNGKGKRLVGDSYENFETGDLVLIGPEMPHTWISNRIRKNAASAVVIQFSKKFIGSFLLLPEFKSVAKLLSNSSQGLFFSSKNYNKIKEQINRLPDCNGAEKIISLLSILHQLQQQRSVKLASSLFMPVKGIENETRINKVCQYVQKNANEEVNLEKAASLIHLSNTAFCKFFKRITGKTFSDYVNDIRIGNACLLLTESDKTIAEIAYKCGFENLTYFNRVFLKKKNTTPGSFRKSMV